VISLKFKKIIKTFGLLILFFIVVILVWEFGAKFFNVPTYIIPAPSDIYSSIVERGAQLIRHIIVTLEEIVFGFLVGVAIGTLAGIGVTHSGLLKGIIYPIAILMRTLPLIVLAPILILWFGWGITSKIIIITIIVFFPIFVNTATGLLAVEPEYLDLMRSMKATKTQIFLKLRFPNSLPYYFAGLKIGIGSAVVGAIIGEFVAPTKGLGYMSLMALTYIDVPFLFLNVLLIALIFGMGFFGLICLIEKLLVPWKAEEIT